MAPAGWVRVPADSSHPRGPRGAREASALMVLSSGLLRTEREAGGVGARLAACCPARPQPREQPFRPQGVALMSLESRDDRRPGVREQGGVLYNQTKSLTVQSAGGRGVPSLPEEECGRNAQPAPYREPSLGWGPPPARPVPPSPSHLFPSFSLQRRSAHHLHTIQKSLSDFSS